MIHDAYKEQLSALLDGELSDAERVKTLAHLEICADCRAYLAELTALRDALGDQAEIEAPEGFADGVLARLHMEDARRTKTRRTWGALVACAAVVVLAVSALPRMGAGGGAPDGAPRAAEEYALTAEAAPAEAEDAAEAPMATYHAASKAAEDAGTVLTLRGAGAEAWLAEHGAADGSGGYRVPVAALEALPEGLSLEGVVEPEDGLVAVIPLETEAAP